MKLALCVILCWCFVGPSCSAPDQYSAQGQQQALQPNVAIRGLGHAQAAPAYQPQVQQQGPLNFPQQPNTQLGVSPAVAPYVGGGNAVTQAPLQQYQQQPLPQFQQQPLSQFQQAQHQAGPGQQYTAGPVGISALPRPGAHSANGFSGPAQSYQAQGGHGGTSGAAQAYQAQGGHGGSSDDGNAKYAFNWEVNDEYNQYGHTETRDGYKTTGKYFTRLPDGRTQIVSYTADLNGYKPDVKYEGQAIAVAAPRPLGGGNAQYQPSQQQANYAGQSGLSLPINVPIQQNSAPFIGSTPRPDILPQFQAGHGQGIGYTVVPQQLQQQAPPQFVSPAPFSALQVTPAPYAGSGQINVQQQHASAGHQNFQQHAGAGQLNLHQHAGVGQQNFQQQHSGAGQQYAGAGQQNINQQHIGAGQQYAGAGQQNFQQQHGGAGQQYAGAGQQNIQQQHVGAGQQYAAVGQQNLQHALPRPQVFPQQQQHSNVGTFPSVTSVSPITPTLAKY